MDPERAKYLRIIERRFLELRGRGLMLSPRDVMLVESWRQREIPTRVILGALEDGARRFWEGRPHGTPLPASLAYFAPHIDDATRQRIADLIEASPVLLFMKGVRGAPQCGFSAQVCQVLDRLLPDYTTHDVLSDPEIREGIKAFSSWPTIPQVYVKGEFIGGSDILIEMYNSGELKEKLEIALAS